jgi:hypothetical protein
MTGLRQRCAVFVDWSIEVQPEDIVNRGVGYVPAKLLRRIVAKFQAYHGIS